jgi:monoterpene epsilon-lactone hydrolase
MASWQARSLTFAIRLAMRRLAWGDERTLTRRARRVFGAPNPLQWLRTRDVRVESVPGRVSGEWITPPNSDRGVIMYLHGGGYVACSAATDRPIAAGLARLTGRRVFSPEYRLAPEHRFPAALDDAVAAYRWVLGQGVPARCLTVAGTSAGGGLALATLLRVRDEGTPLPMSAVCFSPWTDLACTGESLRQNEGRCAMFRRANITDFARVYLGDASPQNPYASPVFGDLGGLPPLLLQVASDELLLDDSRRIHDNIRKAGGVCRLEVFDGVFHGWQMLDGFLPEARRALQQAAAFVNDSC